MKVKKQIVNKIIRSLEYEVDDWKFEEYIAYNSKFGIKIWTANCPILNLSIFQPISLSFSLWDKIIIYRALSKCKALKIIELMNV